MSNQFLNALRSGRCLLMDGAMGTELSRAGLSAGECGELWNLTHPNRVSAIHKAYMDAGAEVLVTNTFQANPLRLIEARAEVSCAALLTEGLRLASSASAAKHFTLVSIGPFLAPGSSEAMLDPAFLRSFGPALRFADGVLLETWSGPLALELAEMLRNQDSALADKPILLSLTFQHASGPDQGDPPFYSFGGARPPEWFANRVEQKGFAALGVNCGKGLSISDCADIVRRFRRETDLPLFARPNAGTPTKNGEALVYPETPAKMAEAMPRLLEAGVCMVGGCCGTTPAHIAAFQSVVKAWRGQTRRPEAGG